MHLPLPPTAPVPALAALPASAPGQVLSFPARGDLVVFSATAVDGKGRPVTNLKQNDFRVFEEGRPQPISRFYGGQELPARVLLLVDGSGSMDEELKLTSVRFAAERVLDALNDEDQVALAGFDSRYWGIAAFTRDREAIRQGLAEVEMCLPYSIDTLHQTISLALAIRRGPWKYLDHKGSGGNRYDRGVLQEYSLPEKAPEGDVAPGAPVELKGKAGAVSLFAPV